MGDPVNPCPWTSDPEVIFPPANKGGKKDKFLAKNFGATVHFFSWVPINGEERRYNIVWEDVKLDVEGPDAAGKVVKRVTGTSAVIFKQHEDDFVWKIPFGPFDFVLDLTVTEEPSGN